MAIVQENLSHIHQQMAAACSRSGRSLQEVELVAVTKTVPVSRIREAIDAGVRVLGENRVQEAADKANELDREVVWHLVGHLQSNKVKRACEIFSVIESVDSLRLAKEIDARAGQLGRTIEVLLEVNTSNEPSKFGVAPEQVIPLAKEIALYKHIRLTGLMTVAAFLPDPQEVRPCFRLLRTLRNELQHQGVPLKHLSMGMSNDFEQAIEEGATLVRLGRALFGERT
ncbi:MAG: hypothetical protein BWY83_01126 [bacterium ADurb.Bin478]|nr:MAG: hypothetical protein BWY83_01126 [bacterium ADurb.Bin478]